MSYLGFTSRFHGEFLADYVDRPTRMRRDVDEMPWRAATFSIGAAKTWR